MTTPIYDFLVNNSRKGISRFYMPGHKGNFPQNTAFSSEEYNLLNLISKLDLTEITDADALFEADGIIAQSEENTAKLYKTAHTSFSAGGSTLCIQAMVRLVANEGDTIIAARNTHCAFINSCALLDIIPYFIKPNYNDAFFVSGEIIPQSVEDAIKACPKAKAVYITSPDYLGGISDIKATAQICDSHKIPLIVDNAHGAHLKFTVEDRHPISLGATLCCDSAHKTLPVFTGGAYLHVNKKSGITKRQVKEAMGLFGSTSPSYLIMMTLDLNNRYLAENAKSDFAKLESDIRAIEKIAATKGLFPISNNHDITKLTFDAYQVGMTGEELKAYFNKHMIEPEYTAARHVVLMCSPQNTAKDFKRLENALLQLVPKKALVAEKFDYAIPAASTRIRKAILGAKEEIPIEESIGRIAAETRIKCPPGVPIIIAGEKIDEQTQKLLKKTSIFTICVIK